LTAVQSAAPSRPLRIAMVGFRGIPHSYGGNEEFIRHLGPRLVERGHHVWVYSRSRDYPDRAPEWRGVRRVFYPAPEHKWMGQLTHAALSMSDAVVRRPDVTFVQTLPSAPFTVLPWLAGERVVVNVNGMEWGRDKWGTLAKEYFRTAARIVVRTANAIVADSSAMRSYYRERFGRDAYFIPYGSELETSTNPALLEAYDVQARNYYLMVSRFVPENNVDFIIDEFRRSGIRRPLLVVGSANYSNGWVASLLSRFGGPIRFVGHVPDPEHLRELHCNSYAYLHGHSLGGTNPSLLRALGCGECVAALDNPFNREVLLPDCGTRYGLLFPKEPGGLARVLAAIDAQPERAAELRERAPARIRQAYTWESVTDHYEELFVAVAGSTGRRKLP
jgi:glycosyltransferase involved in cell wall biosynthesis